MNVPTINTTITAQPRQSHSRDYRLHSGNRVDVKQGLFMRYHHRAPLQSKRGADFFPRTIDDETVKLKKFDFLCIIYIIALLAFGFDDKAPVPTASATSQQQPVEPKNFQPRDHNVQGEVVEKSAFAKVLSEQPTDRKFLLARKQ